MYCRCPLENAGSGPALLSQVLETEGFTPEKWLIKIMTHANKVRFNEDYPVITESINYMKGLSPL